MTEFTWYFYVQHDVVRYIFVLIIFYYYNKLLNEWQFVKERSYFCVIKWFRSMVPVRLGLGKDPYNMLDNLVWSIVRGKTQVAIQEAEET